MRFFFRTLLTGTFLLGLTLGCQKEATAPNDTVDKDKSGNKMPKAQKDKRSGPPPMPPP
jgi:hypothetical protein